jgi:hypothetical protein
VTVEGVTRVLLYPFFVVATQNPHQFRETCPFPRASSTASWSRRQWATRGSGRSWVSRGRRLSGGLGLPLLANYCVAVLCSMPPLTPAHCRAGRPQSAMKPAAAPSSKVLFGS